MSTNTKKKHGTGAAVVLIVLCLLALGTLGYIIWRQFDPVVPETAAGYVAAAGTTAPVYDENGTQLGSLVRGAEVQYVAEDAEGGADRVRVVNGEGYAYLDAANLTADYSSAVLTETVYALRGMSLTDETGAVPGCAVEKGMALTVTGFDGLDENGEVTDVPYDQATYMDVAPEDRCENVRREICLTLERMGIQPESSHHEEGPGQNEVDFRYSDPLSAADNAVTFLTVVKTIAARNGLYADFSPRPLEGRPGSGFHINMSVQGGAEALMHRAMGGILDKITDMTLFLNPTEQSYSRLGAHKAPKYISWSSNNRSQLIRVPAASGEYRRFELRSPDCTANPYLAFALLIWAGLSGIENDIALPEACNVNLHTADSRNVTLATLPKSLSDAEKCAADSNFIAQHFPQSLIEFFTK